MIMTTTVSFIEHVPCVLQGVVGEEVPFRTEGLAPWSLQDGWLSALFENASDCGLFPPLGSFLGQPEEPTQHQCLH